VSAAIEEGDSCSNAECVGVLKYCAPEGCTCHINPPCSACVDNPLTCNVCMLEPGEVEPVLFPAMYTVFWPGGQTVHCCQSHFNGVNLLAAAMGIPAPDFREEDGHQCENCINEAKKGRG